MNKAVENGKNMMTCAASQLDVFELAALDLHIFAIRDASSSIEREARLREVVAARRSLIEQVRVPVRE